MNTRITSIHPTRTSPSDPGTVQLVQPDIAQATEPSLFDNIPESALTHHHRTLIDARVGDRMLLCLSLNVSSTTAKVAAAIAYHGWTSWPARETLAELADVLPSHVSRATKELEQKGLLRRGYRYHKGGHVGILYSFIGHALIAHAGGRKHPVLGEAITSLAQANETASTNLVPADIAPAQAAETASTKLVLAPPKLPSQSHRPKLDLHPEDSGRENQIGTRASTNLVPEPEVTEPEEQEGVTLIDDVNQSNSGSSGSIRTDDENRRDASTIPAWFHDLQKQLNPNILPDLTTLQEDAMLAGWTDQVMASAARLYARNYRNRWVNNPGALFRKLATQEASKVAVPPKQSRPSHSEDRRRRR